MARSIRVKGSIDIVFDPSILQYQSIESLHVHICRLVVFAELAEGTWAGG